jgi:hypothetical protein
MMCDDESSGLQNTLKSHPRREPKIILEKAEYIFPALKNSLVSFCVCAHRTEHYKCVLPENYFGEILPLNISRRLFNLVA